MPETRVTMFMRLKLTETMVKEVCYECVIGIRVGGNIVNMIRYADKAVVAMQAHRKDYRVDE